MPYAITAQSKIKRVYSVTFNDAINQVVSKDPSITVESRRAPALYISAGLQKTIDTTYIIYAGLRYGRENSNFMAKLDGEQLPDIYFFSNRTLTLLLAPGLVLNKHQRLFATIGLARFFESNVGGFGERSRGLGRSKRYRFAENLNRNTFDYRLGLKWQIKPKPEKKFGFEIGTEVSHMQHHGKLQVVNAYNTLPAKYYDLSYVTVRFYFGFIF